MQEFSSISVSSYEAGSLADRLTEQSNDGWTVVTIVPTGSTITAYLSRSADEALAATTQDAVAALAEEPSAEEPVEEHPVEELPVAEQPVESSLQASDPIVPAAVVPDVGGTGAASAAEEISPSPASADTTASSATAQASTAGDTTASSATEQAATTSDTTASTATATGQAGAAPAGWYADPSSRFELRYWDGSQWTEHVSRAGQQYTDPPVA